MKVKALQAGNYALEVIVNENGNRFNISLEVVEPVKQKGGCNSGTILLQSLLLLGLVLLRKKSSR